MGNKIRDRRLVLNARTLCRQTRLIRDRSVRNSPFAVTLNHRQRAAGKISQTARQIAIRAIDQRFISKAAVSAEDHLAQAEEANRCNGKVWRKEVGVKAGSVRRPPQVAEPVGKVVALRK